MGNNYNISRRMKSERINPHEYTRLDKDRRNERVRRR